MRLKEAEKIAIREAVLAEDPAARVYLFGSRARDDCKGGDIDLYIETEFTEGLLKHKARILARIWQRIGEQKIDILLKPIYTPLQAIHRLAKNTGVRL